MHIFICSSCGAKEFYDEDGFRVCQYCGTKHIISNDDRKIRQSRITLQDDVSKLLLKCKKDPQNEKKYAQYILEIDPYNKKAKTILAKYENSRSGCFIATAVYGSYDCPQVWTLRRYRDYTLAETWRGRAFINSYYAVSPTLVKWFGETEWFKNMWRPKLDKMVKELNEKGVADTPYHDRIW